MAILSANSQKIKNMSLLCAAFVVSIHIRIPKGLETSTWFINQLLVDGVARIAVPFFFVVSGFFLAAHFNENGWYKCEVKRRIKSLLVPYFIWSILYIILPIPLSIIADFIANRPFGTSWLICYYPNKWEFIGIDLTNDPILLPLWYIRCLMFFVLLSPIFSFFISKLGYGWLFICFALNLLHSQISNGTIQYFFDRGFSLFGMFYFSVGIFLQKRRDFETTKLFATCAGVIGLILLTIKIICFYNTCEFYVVIERLSIPFLLYAIWHFMPSKHLPDWLTSCSFPIYLTHCLLFPFINCLLNFLHIGDEWLNLQLSIRFLIGFLGSIAIAFFLRRYAPKLAKILFGGR